MFKSPLLRFFYILGVSIATVVVSYLLGDKGLEAFYITTISLCLLFSWLIIEVIRVLYRTDVWLIAKIILTVPLLALFLFGLGMALLNLPLDSKDAVNGWLVTAGIVLYMIPRVGLYRKTTTTYSLGIGVVATFLAVLILFMAFQGFLVDAHGHHSVTLILAVQLQLVMTYIVVHTNYIIRSKRAIENFSQKYRLGDRAQAIMLLFTTGLPLLAPILIIFYFAI